MSEYTTDELKAELDRRLPELAEMSVVLKDGPPYDPTMISKLRTKVRMYKMLVQELRRLEKLESE